MFGTVQMSCTHNCMCACKLGGNYVLFLGRKIPASTSLKPWMKTWLSTKLQYSRWPTPAILRVTHTVVCTAHLYSTKHTVVLIWFSWGVKNHATSFLFSFLFQHKIYNFFFKNVFNKKCQKCWDCIPLYYEAC